MKLRILACVLACLMLLTGVLTGCEVIDLNTVLTVNGVEVTGGEFNFFMDTYKNMIAEEMGFDVSDANSWQTVEIDNRKAIDVAKDNAIDEIVFVWVQAQKAQEEGLELSADELQAVEENYAYFVEQYGGAAAFEEMLSTWEVSKESVKEILKKYAYATKLQNKYVTEDAEITNITEEELLAQYENTKMEYYSAAITAKHILVLFNNTEKGITRTKEQAKAEAQALLDRVNAGEDFETVMRAHSEDSEISFDGYSFIHGDGQYVTAFDDGAYALEVGEVSDLIETEYGYHIIKRYPSEEEFTAYEDLKEDLKAQIAYERYSALVTDTWVANATVERNAKILDKVK